MPVEQNSIAADRKYKLRRHMPWPVHSRKYDAYKKNRPKPVPTIYQF